MRRIFLSAVLACAAALPVRAENASPSAPPQAAAIATPGSGPAADQQRRQMCNRSLDQYVNHGGPIPPPMCSQGGAPAAPEAAGYGQAATNCTTDLYGDRHCVTRIPGKPLIFTDCAPGSRDGDHCDPK